MRLMKMGGTVIDLARSVAPARPQVIFDADMSSDIDDLGALAILNALADLGECDIIGMMVSSQNDATAPAMDVVNHWYGRGGIPIGVRPDMQGGGNYPGAIIDAYPGLGVTTQNCPLAVTLYRQLLAGAADKSVTIIVTGYMTNIKALITSPADGVSPLTGSELIAQKVKLLSVMGGVFPSGNEFNWVASGDDSAYVAINAWPSAVTYAGYEVGNVIHTGGAYLLDNTPANNPVRIGWAAFHNPGTRQSWDSVAVYAGIRTEDPLFNVVDTGYCAVNPDGTNQWVASPDPTGDLEQKYLVNTNTTLAQNTFNALMIAPPAP